MRVFDIDPRALHDPPLADKLTVGEKAVDGLLSEEVDVPLHEVDALLRVGRAFLGQHGEQQRIGDSVVDDDEHEDVDDYLNHKYIARCFKFLSCTKYIHIKVVPHDYFPIFAAEKQPVI